MKTSGMPISTSGRAPDVSTATVWPGWTFSLTSTGTCGDRARGGRLEPRVAELQPRLLELLLARLQGRRGRLEAGARRVEIVQRGVAVLVQIADARVVGLGVARLGADAGQRGLGVLDPQPVVLGVEPRQHLPRRTRSPTLTSSTLDRAGDLEAEPGFLARARGARERAHALDARAEHLLGAHRAQGSAPAAPPRRSPTWPGQAAPRASVAASRRCRESCRILGITRTLRAPRPDRRTVVEVVPDPLDPGVAVLLRAEPLQAPGGALNLDQVEQEVVHRVRCAQLGGQRGVLRVEQVLDRNHALGVGVGHQVEVLARGDGRLARQLDVVPRRGDAEHRGANAQLDLLRQLVAIALQREQLLSRAVLRRLALPAGVERQGHGEPDGSTRRRGRGSRPGTGRRSGPGCGRSHPGSRSSATRRRAWPGRAGAAAPRSPRRAGATPASCPGRPRP